MVNRLEALFPKLATDGYRVTSPPTIFYNCLAWAAGENWRWWWPDEEYYWPRDVPCELSLQAFTQAYETLGYEVCTDVEVEIGYEKIALYANAGGIPTHAAKQLASGLWSSKIGRGEDIEHARLESLTGGIYSEVTRIMRRLRQD